MTDLWQPSLAQSMAPMPTGMLFLTSSGRHCQLSGIVHSYPTYS